MVSLEHKPALLTGNKKIGSATTYIYVDTTNNKIQLFVNSIKVEDWA